MAHPERFSNLPDYAFPRLRKLLSGIQPGGEPMVMTIGEPRHAMPEFVGQIMADHIGEFAYNGEEVFIKLMEWHCEKKVCCVDGLLLCRE